MSNVAYACCHPIETVQGTAQTICTIIYSLGKVTVEGIDLCILSVTDPHAAQKKLQPWKQKFIKVAGNAYKQYQETSSRDITKIISSFGTEMFLVGKVFRALNKLCSFTHTKTSKLVKKLRKVTDSSVATTPEGLTAQVNAAVKHTENHSIKTKPINRNTLIVNNMPEFLNNFKFERELKKNLQKTNYRFQGQSIYKLTNNINSIKLKKGYYLYLDNLHKNHIEVFDTRGNFITVLNLDETQNLKKLYIAQTQNRKINVN